MILKRLMFIPFVFLGFCISLYAQPSLNAIRIEQAPVIDGKLNDATWESVPIATNFIQNFPDVGQPATVRSEVRVVYDNYAVYVGAYLYDNPANIRKQLTARDDEQQSDVDYFSIFFDTYNDKQNGFQFLVTSVNVQTDARMGPNLGSGYGSYGDKTWDAVWESKVAMHDDGWSVEMRIPYISLRFSDKAIQDWGLQFLRFTRRNNETSFWSPVSPDVNGFLNQFGLFKSLQNIEPPLRLSFSPYVSGGVRVNPDGNEYKTDWLRNGGMDVKYGINESFTLDATLIPYFGQVISDNLVNNLTPFEVQFEENRPFFTEGTELFNKAGLFYSRRVGAIPTGYNAVDRLPDSDPDIDIIKNPSVTQLYNAIKFSGRTKKKTGIGIFNAVTAPTHAIVYDRSTGEERKIETETLTNYNIVVIDQSLKGRSYVTLTNTNVLRSGKERDANVTAVDFSLYDNKNIFNLRGATRYSKIFGADTYDGYNTFLKAAKVSGNIQYSAQATLITADYDPRDLGYLQAPNRLIYTANASYNHFTPTKNFLNYNYSLFLQYNRLYDPNQFASLQMEAKAFYFFKNFWDISLTAGAYPVESKDHYVLNTPGRYVKRPAFVYTSLSGSTDSRKRLFVSYNALGGFFKEDKFYSILGLGARYRFSNKFSLDLNNSREKETDYIVYAGRQNGDPIIGFVDFTDVTSLLTGTYNFTSRMNVSLRARHYWSKVIFNRLNQVTADGDPGAPVPLTPGYDANVNIFNIDAFFTWDFRLGSRIILGYKNWLGNDEQIDGTRHRSYLSNVGQLLHLRHGNEFTFRFIYFLDYNQFRKK